MDNTKVKEFGELMINKAIKDILSYDQKEILKARLKSLRATKWKNKKDRRRIITRKKAILDRLKWDISARRFFRDNEYMLYSGLAGMDADWVIDQVRKRF